MVKFEPFSHFVLFSILCLFHIYLSIQRKKKHSYWIVQRRTKLLQKKSANLSLHWVAKSSRQIVGNLVPMCSNFYLNWCMMVNLQTFTKRSILFLIFIINAQLFPGPRGFALHNPDDLQAAPSLFLKELKVKS